jgi:hypothetical protein
MQVRAIPVVILSAAVVVLAVTPVAAAPRSCGYVNPLEYHVKVDIGQVSCAEARKAISTVIRGGGKRHGNPNKGLENLYWTLPGGWRCVTGAGGAWACERGGTRAHPRDEISAEQRVEEEITHRTHYCPDPLITLQ